MNEEQRMIRRHSGVPADPVAAIQLARDAFDYAASYQGKEVGFSTEGVRAYVIEIDSVLRHLDVLVRTLAMQVKYRAALAGGSTEVGSRLAAASEHLAALRSQAEERHRTTALCLSEISRVEASYAARHAEGNIGRKEVQ